LDGDGLPDPVYWPLTTSKETVFWRASLGNGDLAAPDFLVIDVNDPRSMALADFDQDGFDDLAVPTFVSNAIVWYRYENGHFAPPKMVAWKNNLQVTRIAAADINGD